MSDEKFRRSLKRSFGSAAELGLGDDHEAVLRVVLEVGGCTTESAKLAERFCALVAFVSAVAFGVGSLAITPFQLTGEHFNMLTTLILREIFAMEHGI